MSLIKGLVLGVALVSAGSPAMACFEHHEQSGSYEEQSPASYADMAGMLAPEESVTQRLVSLDLLTGLGLILLTGSVGLLARQVRTRGGRGEGRTRHVELSRVCDTRSSVATIDRVITSGSGASLHRRPF